MAGFGVDTGLKAGRSKFPRTLITQVAGTRKLKRRIKKPVVRSGFPGFRLQYSTNFGNFQTMNCASAMCSGISPSKNQATHAESVSLAASIVPKRGKALLDKFRAIALNSSRNAPLDAVPARASRDGLPTKKAVSVAMTPSKGRKRALSDHVSWGLTIAAPSPCIFCLKRPYLMAEQMVSGSNN